MEISCYNSGKYLVLFFLGFILCLFPCKTVSICFYNYKKFQFYPLDVLCEIFICLTNKNYNFNDLEDKIELLLMQEDIKIL